MIQEILKAITSSGIAKKLLPANVIAALSLLTIVVAHPTGALLVVLSVIVIVVLIANLAIFFAIKYTTRAVKSVARGTKNLMKKTKLGDTVSETGASPVIRDNNPIIYQVLYVRLLDANGQKSPLNLDDSIYEDLSPIEKFYAVKDVMTVGQTVQIVDVATNRVVKYLTCNEKSSEDTNAFHGEVDKAFGLMFTDEINAARGFPDKEDLES